jgi:hypothetical protein
MAFVTSSWHGTQLRTRTILSFAFTLRTERLSTFSLRSLLNDVSCNCILLSIAHSQCKLSWSAKCISKYKFAWTNYYQSPETIEFSEKIIQPVKFEEVVVGGGTWVGSNSKERTESELIINIICIFLTLLLGKRGFAVRGKCLWTTPLSCLRGLTHVRATGLPPTLHWWDFRRDMHGQTSLGHREQFKQDGRKVIYRKTVYWMCIMYGFSASCFCQWLITDHDVWLTESVIRMNSEWYFEENRLSQGSHRAWNVCFLFSTEFSYN